MGQSGTQVEQTESQDEFYQRVADEYGAALARMAYAYEADPDLRRDLSQEIHLALWRSLGKFSGRCSIRTWVYRVAHNVATSHVVKQSKNRSNERAFQTLEITLRIAFWSERSDAHILCGKYISRKYSSSPQ